ncbi:MAG: hypothetical protein U1F65_00050 [Verrucomicrobiota bacterium]
MRKPHKKRPVKKAALRKAPAQKAKKIKPAKKTQPRKARKVGKKTSLKAGFSPKPAARLSRLSALTRVANSTTLSSSPSPDPGK